MSELANKRATQAQPGRTRRALSPFDSMDQMLEDWFPRGWVRPRTRDWPQLREVPFAFEGNVPRVDVIDREDEVFVRAELPGVDKKDLDIAVSDNTVIIKGSTRHQETEEKGDFYRCEIAHGAFSRTVLLPVEVDAEKVKSTFKDGVLELEFAKLQKAKRRAIKID